MIFVSLVLIQIFLVFIVYIILSKKLLKHNPLDQYRNEINSLIIAFNRNAEESISVLEKKIEEVQILNTIMDEKFERLKKEQVLGSDFYSKNSLPSLEPSLTSLKGERVVKKKVKKSSQTNEVELFSGYPHSRFEAYLDRSLEEDISEKKELSLEEKLKKLSQENRDTKFLAKELHMSLDEVNFLMKKYRLIA